MLSEDCDISEAFNDCFANIGLRLAENIPILLPRPENVLPFIQTSFQLLPVSRGECITNI